MGDACGCRLELGLELGLELSLSEGQRPLLLFQNPLGALQVSLDILGSTRGLLGLSALGDRLALPPVLLSSLPTL